MTIAVASGKGGTGKTLVSTSLALSAEKCTYVDLDVEDPNGCIFLKPDIKKIIPYKVMIPRIDETECTFCGKCAQACLYNALTIFPELKKTMLQKDLCHSCGACSYACPVYGAIQEEESVIGQIRTGSSGDVQFIEGRLNIGQPSGVPLISGIIKDFLDRQRLLILDAAPGTSCPVVESLKQCDYVILVTEPNPFGLNDLKLSIELIQDMDIPSGILINKDNGKDNIINDFAKTVNIPILKRIPYALSVQESYSKGIPLIHTDPKLKEEFKNLLYTITANGK